MIDAASNLDTIATLRTEIRRLETKLAEERRSHLAELSTFKARVSDLEQSDMLNGILEILKSEGVVLRHDMPKQIAKEVLFERQRWGLPYKIATTLKSLFR